MTEDSSRCLTSQTICGITLHIPIYCISREEWGGSPFLADPVELSDPLAREFPGYRPTEAPAAKASLKGAISNCWEAMRRST